MANEGSARRPTARQALKVSRRVWRTTLALLVACCCRVATAEPRFERVDSLDGLSHNSVTAITQDRRGFLWIGTLDGLNRYDGLEFSVWRHDPADPESLSSNAVIGVVEDHDGSLWVATDRGIDRFDRYRREGPRFQRYAIPRRGTEKAPVGLRTLFLDHRGEVWAGLDDGLLRYRRSDDRFERIEPDPASATDPASEPSLAAGAIVAIQQGPTGALWVLTVPLPTAPGVAALHRLVAPAAATVESPRAETPSDRFQVEPFPLAPDQRPTGFWIDRSGKVWLNLPGLAVLDPETQAVDGPRLPESHTPVGPLWADTEGDLWIASDRGFLRHRPGQGLLGVFPAAARGDRVAGFAQAFFEDRSGTRWLGTRAGLFRWDPQQRRFHHRGSEPHEGLAASPDLRVSSMLQASSGAVWVGTYGTGLRRFEDLDGSVTTYRHDPESPESLCDDMIWHLARGPGADLWLGVDGGLCRFDPDRGRFSWVPLGRPGLDLRAGSVRFIAPSASGVVWLATTQGLLSWVPESGVVRAHGPFLTGSAEAPPIHSLLLEEGRRLWLSAQGRGLYAFDLESEELIEHPLSTAPDGRRLGESLYEIQPAGDGALWLGSGDGLIHYDPASGAVEHFDTRQGLAGSSAFSILHDPEGRLWMGTNQGLSRFDPRLPKESRFRSFEPSDGIGNLEFNRHAATQLADGRFLLGGMHGLTWFHPAEMPNNEQAPPIALTRVQIASTHQVLDFDPGEREVIEVPARTSSLAFEFAALNFTAAGANRYAYRLEGFDRQWIDNGTQRSARYHRVPPGRYLLRVRGSNNDGYWAEHQVAVRVEPSVWQTGWFRVAALAVLGVALVQVHRRRVERLLAVERLRSQIASDLHDELGSELTGMALALDLVQQGPPNGGTDPRLAAIRERAVAMLDRLREIVWCVHPEHDSQAALTRRLRRIADATLSGRSYRFDARSPVDGRLSLPIRRNLLLIYREALHNAVRHADAQHLDIHLACRGGALVLTVRDDGRGFDPGTVGPGTVGPGTVGPIAEGDGLGLSNMRRRAQEMGAHLTVASQVGQGTEIELRVPLRRWR